METVRSKGPMEMHLNNGLAAVFVDNVYVTTRRDGTHFIRLLTNLPEGLQEGYRMMVPDPALKRMLDTICSHLDYYPKKPAEQRGSASRLAKPK